MGSEIFKRKIYDKMLDWKNWASGNYALLIEGARRIGKSTVAEEFARNEYEEYLLIDFSNVSEDMLHVFDFISDLNQFFMRLKAMTGKSLPERRSVIIFDEVQFCPRARQAIKHLVKDGRYDYIETGSLISIKKNVRDILIPSEEYKLPMYPMDLEEFMWATGKNATFDMIRHLYDHKEAAGDALHRTLMREFRLYMLVGGMPQAVSTYIDTSDFAKIDRVKREILGLYSGDFMKIDPSGKATSVFDAIPSELSRNTTSYKVGRVVNGARPSRMDEIFNDIRESRTVNFAYHANDPDIGFALHTDYDNFKMYMADTGLFITQAFMNRDFTDNDIYRKLLSDKLSADLGYVYENVVAQLLRTSGHSLFYYTWKEQPDEDVKPRSYEIDFLLSSKDKICPIEVKSSGYLSHKSLDKFAVKYSSRISTRYIIYTKDYRKEHDIVCLPVYMTGLL